MSRQRMTISWDDLKSETVEKKLQQQRKEKEAKRVLRKAEKPSRGTTAEGEDPDLAGLQWGPQPPAY